MLVKKKKRTWFDRFHHLKSLFNLHPLYMKSEKVCKGLGTAVAAHAPCFQGTDNNQCNSPTQLSCSFRNWKLIATQYKAPEKYLSSLSASISWQWGRNSRFNFIIFMPIFHITVPASTPDYFEPSFPLIHAKTQPSTWAHTCRRQDGAPDYCLPCAFCNLRNEPADARLSCLFTHTHPSEIFLNERGRGNTKVHQLINV